MKRYWAILALVLGVSLFVLGGCGQDKEPASIASGKDKTKSDIEAAVTWYNALLAEGYRNLRMNSLVQVATEKCATKAYVHMASLGEAGLKMDANLKKIDFGDITDIATDKVEASTEEIWDYIYWDIKTGKQLFDNTVTYSLVYKLEKRSDKWLVTDITVKKTQESKDSSFIFQRPPGSRPGEPSGPREPVATH